MCWLTKKTSGGVYKNNDQELILILQKKLIMSFQSKKLTVRRIVFKNKNFQSWQNSLNSFLEKPEKIHLHHLIYRKNRSKYSPKNMEWHALRILYIPEKINKC